MSSKLTKDYYLYLSLGLIITSFFIFSLTQPNSKHLSVEATITNINTTSGGKPVTCAPLYQYTIDEFNYENMSTNKSPNFCSYKNGDKVKVSVDKKDKYKVSTPNSSLLNMEKIIALILLVTGIGMLVNTIYTYRPRKNIEKDITNKDNEKE